MAGTSLSDFLRLALDLRGAGSVALRALGRQHPQLSPLGPLWELSTFTLLLVGLAPALLQTCLPLGRTLILGLARIPQHEWRSSLPLNALPPPPLRVVAAILFIPLLIRAFWHEWWAARRLAPHVWAHLRASGGALVSAAYRPTVVASLGFLIDLALGAAGALGPGALGPLVGTLWAARALACFCWATLPLWEVAAGFAAHPGQDLLLAWSQFSSSSQAFRGAHSTIYGGLGLYWRRVYYLRFRQRYYLAQMLWDFSVDRYPVDLELSNDCPPRTRRIRAVWRHLRVANRILVTNWFGPKPLPPQGAASIATVGLRLLILGWCWGALILWGLMGRGD